MSLFELPFISKFYKSIVEDCQSKGLPTAISIALKKCHLRIKTVGLTSEINEVLKTKSAIVIANHPSETEPLIILSQISPRQDVKMITQKGIVQSLPGVINKYLIPVTSLSKPLKSKYQIRPWLFSFFLPKITENHKDVHAANIASIQTATEAINRGGLMIIFPAPAEADMSVPWKKGLAHMISGLKKPEEVYLISCYISGTSFWDFIRIIPLINRLMPEITINFLAAKNLKNYAKLEKDVLINQLRKDYISLLKEADTH